MKRPHVTLLALAGAAALAVSAPAATDYHDWAPRPPMGWNSWDNFGTTVTEAQTKAEADFMAAKLAKFGWEYVIVDIQWYEPHAAGHDYRPGAPLTMDGFGRLQPAPNKFPSAANGDGFKSLAAYVHGLGLKFGVHLMRGIPRQAVEKNLPIAGTDHHAADVANRQDTCPWNPDMYGVDVTKPGAQDYYDSVFAMMAGWGIDYVKVDDIARPYHQGEIEAIRRAIDRTGRPIVLSLSPGDTPLSAGPHVKDHANLWRISDDFWDRWLALYGQFGRLDKWTPYRVPGAWPDADMLPLGLINLGERTTRFTPDEQRTLMTLWCIARSPLMHGGDMVKTDDVTLALLTNAEVLAVNQDSANNHALFNHDDLIAWIADVPGSPDKYLAVFNARDRVALTPANAVFASGAMSAKTEAAAVDVDVRGANRIYLAAQLAADGPGAGAAWRSPRLVFADGSVHSLTELKWTHADATWDSTTAHPAADGKPASLTGLAPSVVEYALPADAVRFQATVAVEGDEHSTPLRFLVVPGSPKTESPGATMAVPGDLTTLGFAKGARVRDLWTHQDLGTKNGTFAPEVPWHGAALFRLSPL